jgi:hypothetical protein
MVVYNNYTLAEKKTNYLTDTKNQIGGIYTLAHLLLEDHHHLVLAMWTKERET